MRILVVGTGGVGSAFAQIARRRSFFEHCALADYDAARPAALVAELDDGRFSAHSVDASSTEPIVALIRETRADAVLNSVDPLFNVPIFDACFEAGVAYLDMAMTGAVTDHHREFFFRIGGDLHRDGAEAVLLAGTDLCLVFDGRDCGFPTIDCALAHVEAITRLSLG